MMPKGAARGQRIYKSDTNQMGVLQLLCSNSTHEQIKGAPAYI